MWNLFLSKIVNQNAHPRSRCAFRGSPDDSLASRSLHYQSRQSVSFADAIAVAVARDILLGIEIPKSVAVLILCNQLMASVNNIQLPPHFPDSKGAVEYTLGYIGAQRLNAQLDADLISRAAIAQVVALLSGPVGGHQFCIVLDRLRGNPQPAEDAALLNKISSANPSRKCWAVLRFLYAIRCNTFHGHKGFEPVQLEVMKPANALLRHVTEILFDTLNT